MQLYKFAIAAIVVALNFANATPTPDVENAAEARDNITTSHGGYAWELSDQNGQRWELNTTTSCNNLAWVVVPESNDKISSIQVDAGVVCKFYKNIFCDKNMPFGQGGVVETHGPYTGNVPPGWHDVISSYQCYRK